MRSFSPADHDEILPQAGDSEAPNQADGLDDLPARAGRHRARLGQPAEHHQTRPPQGDLPHRPRHPHHSQPGLQDARLVRHHLSRQPGGGETQSLIGLK